ncbi:hypothetical protein PENTCL1PPCAC_2620, partial [Pristionchus entomophagus]
VNTNRLFSMIPAHLVVAPLFFYRDMNHHFERDFLATRWHSTSLVPLIVLNVIESFSPSINNLRSDEGKNDKSQ